MSEKMSSENVEQIWEQYIYTVSSVDIHRNDNEVVCNKKTLRRNATRQLLSM